MWVAEYSVDINASPEAIFGLFADVSRWPEWNAGTEWVELDGPFGVGTTGRMKVPDQDPLAFRLIAVGPGGFEDETVVPEAGIVVRVRHAIEPLVDGPTRVVYRATIDGAQADELGPQIGPQITGDFPDVLSALKARAEAASSGA
jgi:uncharacterized protein YndB with AHSA1/START domain